MESRPRIQFVELHDLARTPAVLRLLHTEGIAFMYRLANAAQEYARVLTRALGQDSADAETTQPRTIIDLCAGSGGPMPLVQRVLHEEGLHTHITLTDLVPNLPAFQRIKDESRATSADDCCDLDFSTESVDATDCRVSGMRTIFGAFHHFPPALARRVLQNAVDTQSPIVIVDSRRSYFHVLVVPWLTTLFVLLSAPFNLRTSVPRYALRLLLTYLVPVLPFMMLWDSTVSFLRMYSPAELRALIGRLDDGQSFTWTIDVEAGRTGTQFCIGTPKP
jgi:hypothetical protein